MRHWPSSLKLTFGPEKRKQTLPGEDADPDFEIIKSEDTIPSDAPENEQERTELSKIESGVSTQEQIIGELEVHIATVRESIQNLISMPKGDERAYSAAFKMAQEAQNLLPDFHNEYPSTHRGPSIDSDGYFNLTLSTLDSMEKRLPGLGTLPANEVADMHKRIEALRARTLGDTSRARKTLRTMTATYWFARAEHEGNDAVGSGKILAPAMAVAWSRISEGPVSIEKAITLINAKSVDGKDIAQELLKQFVGQGDDDSAARLALEAERSGFYSDVNYAGLYNLTATLASKSPELSVKLSPIIQAEGRWYSQKKAA